MSLMYNTALAKTIMIVENSTATRQALGAKLA
jgi:hypothetical protein